ncbi:MAG: hypothetical protein ACYCQI_08915 [Gammaproteobacteria bacterium]
MNKLCDELNAPTPKISFYKPKPSPSHGAIYGALQIISTKGCPVPLNMPTKKFLPVSKDFFEAANSELKRAARY